ncbi:MAG: hypothetical protein FJ137_15875 [Deltaproteobacteria bacterium]|nr:hypothetical protein [Deltaproteobacteria bacterium]
MPSLLASVVVASVVATLPAPVTLGPRGSLDVDVAVVVDRAEPMVAAAVRAAVFGAARARGARVVDLMTMGLQRAVDACADLACRRDLARRRGAEWYVLVRDDGQTVVLELLDGDLVRAHVVLTGARVVLLGGVPDAVDALFESALPQRTVDRARAIARARAAEDQGYLSTALSAWTLAFGHGIDDRAVEVAFARARVATALGDDLALDRAWDDAEATLVDAAAVSAEARALLVAGLAEHREERAARAAAIAVADTGPDHDALVDEAVGLYERILSSPWAMADQRERALVARAQLRPALASTLAPTTTSTTTPTTMLDDAAPESAPPRPAAAADAGPEDQRLQDGLSTID